MFTPTATATRKARRWTLRLIPRAAPALKLRWDPRRIFSAACSMRCGRSSARARYPRQQRPAPRRQPDPRSTSWLDPQEPGVFASQREERTAQKYQGCGQAQVGKQVAHGHEYGVASGHFRRHDQGAVATARLAVRIVGVGLLDDAAVGINQCGYARIYRAHHAHAEFHAGKDGERQMLPRLGVRAEP